MKRLLAGGVVVGVAVVATGTAAAGVAMAEETALIVPGTGPSPYQALQDLAEAYDYVNMPIHIAENYYDSAGSQKRLVPYPASLWPFSGPGTPTVGESIQIGADNLDADIRSTPGRKVVPSLSQGSMVVEMEKRRLAGDPTAPPPDTLRFIETGNPNLLAQKLFAVGSYIPIANYTVPPDVDSQYDTIAVKAEYDAWADPPDRMDNLLAVVNAMFGGQLYHTETAFTDPRDVPAGDITVVTNSRGGTTTTYFLPAAQLPLTRPLRDQGVPGELVDQLDAVLRPAIDSAYYRHNAPSGPPPAPPYLAPVELSPTDKANIENTVQQIATGTFTVRQSDIDNAVQQMRGMLPPGIG